MQHQKPSRILGHLEYEVNLPFSRTVNSRKKTQVVQTNLNTTIQDIIAEVCNKHEYETKDYELWYGPKKLDNEVTVRHSGLPLNGVLVLLSVADAAKLKDSNVNLGLQLESGKRLTHKFHHEETLWNILQYWELQGEKILKSNEGESKLMVPVCNFLRQTIVGQEQLEQQTLRSLGLIHGSAVVRFFHREENQFGQQANVSAVMSRPITNVNAIVTQSSTIAANRDDFSGSASPNNNIGTSSDSTTTRANTQPPSQNRILGEPVRPVNTPLDSTTVKVPEEETKQVNDGNVILEKRNVDDQAKMESNKFVGQKEVQKEEEPMDEESSNDDVEFDEPLKYCTKGALNILGDNNALLYHLDDVRTRKGDEPDEFFDITVKDLESIYRGLRAKAREFDEAPLLTSSLRQDEELSAQDRALKEHPLTIVRIRFPDRFVLQGTFQSTDYISYLTSFVRQHLNDSTLKFTLFTTPPKTVLDESKTLLSSKLVGFAIVYIGSESTRPEKYLKDNIYSQASDPERVFKNSALLTQTTTKSHTPDTLPSAQSNAPSSFSATNSGANVKSSAAAACSKSEPSSAVHRATDRAPSGAVPKWFKGATTKKP